MKDMEAQLGEINLCAGGKEAITAETRAAGRSQRPGLWTRVCGCSAGVRWEWEATGTGPRYLLCQGKGLLPPGPQDFSECSTPSFEFLSLRNADLCKIKLGAGICQFSRFLDD